MKKFLALILMVILIISIIPVAFASDDVKVTLNGQYITFDQPPMIIDGRTLVPIRAVCEALGADVYWYDAEQGVMIVKNDIKLVLTIGDDRLCKMLISNFNEFFERIQSDGSSFISNIPLGVPPQIIEDRTLLPIRAVCEALGAVVDWNDDNKTVLITCLDEIINDKNKDITFFKQFISWGENRDLKIESAKGQLNKLIPTNPYTNNAWGGNMCEAGDEIYYATSAMLDNTRVSHIIHMNQDGSEQTQFSADYYDIGSVISDGNIIYFDANIGTYDAPYSIYSLPTSGGEAKEIISGNISDLQIAGGRLYWVDNTRTPSGTIKHDQTKTLAIKSINFDGSDEKVLYSTDVSLVSYKFGFLATNDGLYYYVEGSDYNHCNLYRTDFDGNNTKKINQQELSDIHKLFYDNDNLYLVLSHENLDFRDSVNIIDANGKLKPIIKSIGYFPQDYNAIQYCGISDGIFYYFELVSADGGSAVSLKSNLHQYDLKTNQDTIVLFNVEMGDKATKILQSVRGKTIPCSGISGLYIVGNDIYFSPCVLP